MRRLANQLGEVCVPHTEEHMVQCTVLTATTNHWWSSGELSSPYASKPHFNVWCTQSVPHCSCGCSFELCHSKPVLVLEAWITLIAQSLAMENRTLKLQLFWVLNLQQRAGIRRDFRPSFAKGSRNWDPEIRMNFRARTKGKTVWAPFATFRDIFQLFSVFVSNFPRTSLKIKGFLFKETKKDNKRENRKKKAKPFCTFVVACVPSSEDLAHSAANHSSLQHDVEGKANNQWHATQEEPSPMICCTAACACIRHFWEEVSKQKQQRACGVLGVAEGYCKSGIRNQKNCSHLLGL